MDTQQQRLLKILVIGDSCYDVYHYGMCKRVSPEAPVIILDERTIKKTEGMSGNVAANLKAFNTNVQHISNTHRTSKHRYIDSRLNHHLLRVDEPEGIIKEKIDLDVLPLPQEIDGVVISDYNKGFLSREDCAYISKRYKDVPLFVDSKKTDLSCYSNCILKVNNIEYEKIEQMPLQSEMIITQGDKGAIYNSKIYAVEKVEVFDVCGAGDVFLSTLTYFYLLNNNLEDATIKANKAAALSVTKTGTYVLTKADINDLCI